MSQRQVDFTLDYVKKNVFARGGASSSSTAPSSPASGGFRVVAHKANGERDSIEQRLNAQRTFRPGVSLVKVPPPSLARSGLYTLANGILRGQSLRQLATLYRIDGEPDSLMPNLLVDGEQREANLFHLHRAASDRANRPEHRPLQSSVLFMRLYMALAAMKAPVTRGGQCLPLPDRVQRAMRAQLTEAVRAIRSIVIYDRCFDAALYSQATVDAEFDVHQFEDAQVKRSHVDDREPRWTSNTFTAGNIKGQIQHQLDQLRLLLLSECKRVPQFDDGGLGTDGRLRDTIYLPYMSDRELERVRRTVPGADDCFANAQLMELYRELDEDGADDHRMDHEFLLAYNHYVCVYVGWRFECCTLLPRFLVECPSASPVSAVTPESAVVRSGQAYTAWWYHMTGIGLRRLLGTFSPSGLAVPTPDQERERVHQLMLLLEVVGHARRPVILHGRERGGIVPRAAPDKRTSRRVADPVNDSLDFVLVPSPDPEKTPLYGSNELLACLVNFCALFDTYHFRGSGQTDQQTIPPYI